MIIYSLHHTHVSTFDRKKYLVPDLPWVSQTMPGLHPLGHRSFIWSDDPFSRVEPLKTKTYGKFHEYIFFYINPSVVQKKIY